MNRKKIRFTESQLYNIIRKCIKSFVKEKEETSNILDKETVEDILNYEVVYSNDVEDVIYSHFGINATIRDEGLDDMCENEDDTYVMYRLYSVANLDIIVYYGNNTYKVGYIQVRE